MTPGIEPGPHWWEASALTTTASLHFLMTLMHLSMLSPRVGVWGRGVVGGGGLVRTGLELTP